MADATRQSGVVHPSMTAGELRADVPALDDTVYMNYGAHGPSPRYVVSAASEFMERHEFDVPAAGDPYHAAFAAFDETRETVADFVNANPDEIALTESTTAGINAVAGAIDWSPGDIVVRTDLEHPAGRLPWQRLEREGITVRTVETEADRIDRLTDRLADGVPDDRLLSPASPESGLVTVDLPEPERTVERLAEAGIVVRALPSPDAVRASVHAVNTAEEVDRLVDALAEEW